MTVLQKTQHAKEREYEKAFWERDSPAHNGKPSFRVQRSGRKGGKSVHNLWRSCRSVLAAADWLHLFGTAEKDLVCTAVFLSACGQHRIHPFIPLHLGSVFLPLAMLMIILNVTNTGFKRRLPICLFALSVFVFLIAASPGILPIYYKEVSFQIVDGVSTLVKVYGPLHPLYLVYLLGYFAAMVTVIIRASVKKSIDSTSHAVILAIAVFVNIGVWFIEQLSDIDFEMLSISYIISELFLLGIHLVMKENQRLKELVAEKEGALRATIAGKETQAAISIPAEILESFARGLETLTPTERLIYDAYLAGTPTKEILFNMNIKENTLKFHNKNLYSKLGVSSRKQLLEVYRAIQVNSHQA